MNALSTTALALSMSADAFAVSLCKGAALKKPRLRDALRTGAIFGAVEATTPLIGWLAGLAASQYVQAVDHWIAFVILAAIGLKMIYECCCNHHEGKEKKERHGLPVLLATAVATSIDALAVGVTLAFLHVNIWVCAAAIGAATFLMVTIGIMTGHYVGLKAGRAAEGIGGLCLIAIGTIILMEHLGYI